MPNGTLTSLKPTEIIWSDETKIQLYGYNHNAMSGKQNCICEWDIEENMDLSSKLWLYWD